MEFIRAQAELFGLVWQPRPHRFRLRVNDVIRIGGRLGRVIRVTECAAVVLMNQPARTYTTRFDKPVCFQPSPVTFRISANSDVEVINRPIRKRTKHQPR